MTPKSTPQIRKRHRSFSFLAALACFAAATPTVVAATIPFTFSLTANTFISALPTQVALTVPTTLSGAGSFAPFGNAVYSETGNITYAMILPGVFVPASALNSFTASFNAGADTFTGTNSVLFGPLNGMGLPTFSSTLTISGGTGIFSGASGSGSSTGTASPSGPLSTTDPTPVSFSGGGQITAPGLAAVPEPAATVLMGLGLGAVIACRRSKLCKRSAALGNP